MSPSHNSQPSTLSSAALPPHPLVRLGLMARMLHVKIPEVRLSTGWLCQWWRETMAWLSGKQADVRAIDDEMERTAPLLWECLQNDPPEKRRVIWQAWQATHANTEREAATLVPAAPEALLREHP